MMWEEHPEYQKQQARLIGVLLLLLVIVYIVGFINAGDWDSLKKLLLFVGAFIVALALFPVCAWFIVKIVTKRRGGKKPDANHDDSSHGPV